MGKDYQEAKIESAGLNLALNTHLCLIDLLRLEYRKELRYEFVCEYLKEISKGTKYCFRTALEGNLNNTIVLLNDWNLILCSDSLLHISPNTNSIGVCRQNLKL